ncbi:MAG TPA: TIR domain-containing protein [Polyangia bacterium]|jgi:hypothetical protein|nr:TIR domain-containing protein [Polyangia bacterium]
MPDAKKVFIIHGRNLDAPKQLGQFVRALGLTPNTFPDVRASMAGTATVAEIVEAGMADAQAVIALLTADEYSVLRPNLKTRADGPDDIARWQARPNAIFEAGIAFGRDRDRVVFVVLGDPKLFTDVAGIHLLRPTNDPCGDRQALRGILTTMGCAVDQNTTDWMAAGDLVSCVQSVTDVSPRNPFSADVSLWRRILGRCAWVCVGVMIGLIAAVTGSQGRPTFLPGDPIPTLTRSETPRPPVTTDAPGDRAPGDARPRNRPTKGKNR